MVSFTVLNVLFSRALASLVSSSSPVVVSCVNPGFCATGLLRHVPAEILKEYEIPSPHTPEEGARQYVWAAIGRKGREDELRGAYLSDNNIAEASDYVLGEQGKALEDLIWVSD
jgi:NAD(P)-dependent dehydrogenase (short-subunit alcohol dehydrogenase family)